MSSLLVVKGVNVGMRYELSRIATIGRSSENAIQLLDPNVSRFHCEILQRGIAWHLIDKDSKNGILVNGQPVREKTLSRNDEIVVGATIFLFNTDHDLKYTRFSDKRVYMTSTGEETVTPLPEKIPAAALARESYPADGVGSLLVRLGALFSYSDLPFPEALEQVMQTLASLFQARGGCLMKWDPVSSDFVPLVAVAEGDSFALSMNAVRAVLTEKRAVLIPCPEVDRKVAASLRLELPRKNNASNEIALCIPLFHFEPPPDPESANPIDTRLRHVQGILYLRIPEGENLLLQDVQVLQAVANLTQAALEQYEALDRIDRNHPFEDGSTPRLIGQSEPFLHARQLAAKVAAVDSTALLTGETGTGKELIAREIHERSTRRDYPFVAVNCAALPEGLIESELFGHERGAFTGADRMRRGLIENAHGGTLFLDEIGDISLSMQTKFLRFLQDKVIVRVGGNKPIPVNVRILSATNADLEKAVQEKRFREDLWFRLNVFEIRLPALRDRKGDVRLLAEHFLTHYAAEHHKPIAGLSGLALRALEAYRWPGNVRELQNAVERGVLLCESAVLEPADLGLEVPEEEPLEFDEPSEAITMAEAEKRCILHALEACDWNQVHAARLLAIHRNTLHKKIVDLGLKPPARA